ncbi:hypothetical protein FBQ87_07085 [Sphingobacteriales bacterium CHB3]|nr:hypothetical protein [Sphingobacteriales bacterium CHB3]
MTDKYPTKPTRVIKIGTTRIVEDASMSSLDNNAIRDLLKMSYPEIANATVRELDEDGLRVVEFLPQPGRKG